MTRMALVLALLALGAPACGGDGSSAADPPARACTQIGCESGIAVALERLPADARRVLVCSAGRCRDLVADRAHALVRLPATGRQRHPIVSVTVFDRSGGVVVSARRRVRIRRLQPNGPGCGPVCFVGRLTFRGDAGTLRGAGPQSPVYRRPETRSLVRRNAPAPNAAMSTPYTAEPAHQLQRGAADATRSGSRAASTITCRPTP